VGEEGEFLLFIPLLPKPWGRTGKIFLTKIFLMGFFSKRKKVVLKIPGEIKKEDDNEG